MGKRMNTKNIITLKTIIETGSFQKAATKLNYTQSTVTFQIQQLEQELSLKLFERIGRKMELTYAGKEILPLLLSIVQTEEEIKNYGKNLSESKGTLKVGMPDELLCTKMQPILYEFNRQAPNVQLIIEALSCYAIRDKIINGGVDIGIHCDIGGYPNTINVVALTGYKVCLVASSSFGKTQLDFITPNQRKNINLIISDPHSVHQERLSRYLKDKDITLSSNMALWSIGAAKTGVMSNLGIAYLPSFTIEEELQNGKIVPIKTELDDEIVSVIFSYHKNKWISPPMELFIRLIRETLGKYVPN
jgi:DNA-binding transcriptional LysR family regulator